MPGRNAVRSGGSGNLESLFPGNLDAHFAEPLIEKDEHVLDSQSFTSQLPSTTSDNEDAIGSAMAEVETD